MGKLKEFTDKRIPAIYISLFIGLSFLMTGCAYLTWMYRLLEYYDASLSDLYSEVLGYVFQATGILVFILFLRKSEIKMLATSLLAICVITALNFSVSNPVFILFSGFLMNIFIGVVAAYYLLSLTSSECSGITGAIFGFGYAFGTIGTYLLSIVGSKNFLSSPYVVVAYFLMSAAIIFLYKYTDLPTEKMTPISVRNFPILAAFTVFMISLVKGLGFYFPMSDVSSGSVSLELTRLFYALGLMIAGFIIDKNRLEGAIICIIAMVCPFLLFSLSSNNAATTLIWCLGYLFSGFFIIYRTIVFTDVSAAANIRLLACGSLLFGRIGDASGSFVGMMLEGYPSILMIVSLVAFTAAVFLLVAFEKNLQIEAVPSNDTPLSAESVAEEKPEFSSLYDFTSRECEVFELALEGCSNKEIANKLFITENTVKYHVKNLLKKTGCKNKGELKNLYSTFNT